MVDAMAKEAGEDKGFAIVTSTFTTPNQARWIAENVGLRGPNCHPKLKMAGKRWRRRRTNVLSFNQAHHADQQIRRQAFPGLFGMTVGRHAPPRPKPSPKAGSSAASSPVVGLATPNAMKPYVNAGLRQVRRAVGTRSILAMPRPM